jgi:AraC family transcriptional regulator
MVAICPAGADCTAHADSDVDNLLISIDPGTLSLAAAEDAALGAELIGLLTGEDRELRDLARVLAAESAAGYPNGALHWNDVASGFIAGILARHMSRSEGRKIRGVLGQDVLAKLREYIDAHLHDPIDVGTLAGIAGRSPFHFSRVFTRSVGVTPHRYLVHARLDRALRLIRDGRTSLAVIALQTGFADQSHLSRWVRRVHGVSLRQLAS